MSNSTYCANCFNLPVCKYKDLLVEMDDKVEAFNDSNSPNPIRISATINYNCRHKDLVGPT
jgi:hypothetical protein